jgi:hypothetical protein
VVASGVTVPQSNVPGVELMAWLKKMGAMQDKVGRSRGGGERQERERERFEANGDFQPRRRTPLFTHSSRAPRASPNNDQVTIRTLEVAAAGRPLDVTVASVSVAAAPRRRSISVELTPSLLTCSATGRPAWPGVRACVHTPAQQAGCTR